MPKSKIEKSKVLKLGNSEPKERKVRIKPLDNTRMMLKKLVDEANRRVAELADEQLESKAVYEATRTQLPSRRNSDNLFEWNLPRTRDINREFARVTAFLNDMTSMVGGTQEFISGLTHGIFGGQYRANGGYGADPNYVDKDTAERVFKIYHEALRSKGGWERVMGYLKASHTGLVDYGSEELINAIYDMFEGGSMEDAASIYGPDLTSEDYDDFIRKKAEDLIQRMIDSYDTISKMEQEGVDYGILESKEARTERINKWRWKIEREGLKNGRR